VNLKGDAVQSVFIKVPKVAMGTEEGAVVAWHVTVGAKLTRGDDLVEIEFDKATQVLPSPVSGTLEEISVEPGTVVQVGDRLCRVACES
jgi:pyruvate/2-oxoglutarate dehydrogenase complex dihydrolipoamide acyltransferase (E2) component